MKNLKVGDSVIHTRKERNLKRGMKKSDFIKELDDSIGIDYDKIVDKYFTRTFKTKIERTKIIRIDNLKSVPYSYYLLENGHTTKIENLEYIPSHETFAKLLDGAIECQSPFTKTGKLFIHGDVIILEYMKSSRNVWVDEQIGSRFSDEDKKMMDEEIKRFFGSVKTIFYTLPLNETINVDNKKIDLLLK
jgi:hypothetical protein